MDWVAWQVPWPSGTWYNNHLRRIARPDSLLIAFDDDIEPAWIEPRWLF